MLTMMESCLVMFVLCAALIVIFRVAHFKLAIGISAISIHVLYNCLKVDQSLDDAHPHYYCLTLILHP
jgi:hypothetical protein